MHTAKGALLFTAVLATALFSGCAAGGDDEPTGGSTAAITESAGYAKIVGKTFKGSAGARDCFNFITLTPGEPPRGTFVWKTSCVSGPTTTGTFEVSNSDFTGAFADPVITFTSDPGSFRRDFSFKVHVDEAGPFLQFADVPWIFRPVLGAAPEDRPATACGDGSLVTGDFRGCAAAICGASSCLFACDHFMVDCQRACRSGSYATFERESLPKAQRDCRYRTSGTF